MKLAYVTHNNYRQKVLLINDFLVMNACIYIYIYIYPNLQRNAVVRLSHPLNGDDQGQEMF